MPSPGKPNSPHGVWAKNADTWMSRAPSPLPDFRKTYLAGTSTNSTDSGLTISLSPVGRARTTSSPRGSSNSDSLNFARARGQRQIADHLLLADIGNQEAGAVRFIARGENPEGFERAVQSRFGIQHQIAGVLQASRTGIFPCPSHDETPRIFNKQSFLHGSLYNKRTSHSVNCRQHNPNPTVRTTKDLKMVRGPAKIRFSLYEHHDSFD